MFSESGFGSTISVHKRDVTESCDVTLLSFKVHSELARKMELAQPPKNIEQRLDVLAQTAALLGISDLSFSRWIMIVFKIDTYLIKRSPQLLSFHKPTLIRVVLYETVIESLTVRRGRTRLSSRFGKT